MLQSAEFIEAAEAITGLSRFHSNSFREGLDLFVVEFDHSPHVHDKGRAALRKLYVGYLANRLRVDDYFRKKPDLADCRVSSPVMTMGMPRTGTTLVNHLLGTDPARRSLLRWESRQSVPPPTTATLRTDPRCLKMRAEEIKMEKEPDFSPLHYERADGPTECVFVHAQDMKSAATESHAPMPGYSEWLRTVDMASAYKNHKRMLQVLQSEAPGPWNLKTPSHALFIRGLLEVYPDARLIWTHRDPYQTLGSLCSMISRAHCKLGSRADIPFIAANYLQQLSDHVRRPMAVRAERSDEFIYDIHYNDVVADPIGEMRRLYAWLGDEFTDEVKLGMRSWLTKNPQHRFGGHNYSLEQFGLSMEMVRPLFEDYVRFFDVRPDGERR